MDVKAASPADQSEEIAALKLELTATTKAAEERYQSTIEKMRDAEKQALRQSSSEKSEKMTELMFKLVSIT